MSRNHGIMLAIIASAALFACAEIPDQSAGGNGPEAAQIRSTKDLESYLRTTPSSPLDRLSASARQRFLAGLVFVSEHVC